jgi:chromate transporter
MTLSRNDGAREPVEGSPITEIDSRQAHPPAAMPTPLELFLIFSRIGLTSFGGGLSGWFLREFVQDRHWLTEEEFLNGLALSQALPGVNVKNLAIWIGHRLLGWRGALAGFCGIIFPPAVVIVILGAFFSAIAGFSLTHIALAGAAAGAIGLSLSMAITAVRRLPRRVVPLVIFIATFIAVAILALPLVWTVLIAGTLSVAYEYARVSRGE